MSMRKLALLNDALGASFEAKKEDNPPPPPAPPSWSWAHLGIDSDGEVLQAYPKPPYHDGCAECADWNGYIQRDMHSNGMHYKGLEACPHCASLRSKIERINRAKLPSKFTGETLDWSRLALRSSQPAEDVFLGWADNYVETREGVSLALLGPTGRGKSFTAFTLAKYALDSDIDARWLHWPTFLESIKSTYGSNKLRPEDVWECSLPSKGLLVIDDLGAGVVTEWSRQIAWTVFERKPRAVTFVVTSNGHPTADGPGGLNEMIGERGASRMFGVCGRGKSVFQLIGGDKRRG